MGKQTCQHTWQAAEPTIHRPSGVRVTKNRCVACGREEITVVIPIPLLAPDQHAMSYCKNLEKE